MEKVTLKLYEIYSLHAEINGLVNQQTGEVISKGLLNEKLKLSSKYWINELAKKIAEEREPIEKLKEEMIKKYGEEDEKGGIGIPRFINLVKNNEGQIVSSDINPKFVEFEKEFTTLLQEEKSLEHKEFKLSEFENIETERAYPVFFKLVKPE